MANHGYEIFIGALRKSSQREQAEMWRNVLGRSYGHERAALLKQLLQLMDKENPEELRTTFHEFKEEKRAQATGQSATSS